MKKLAHLAVALATAGALTLSACGAGGDPLAEPSSSPSASGGGGGEEVVVGSANFTESQVLGELYAQALEAAGVPASTRPNIGSREVYLTALQDGSVSVVPEYTGNLLLYYDANSPASTPEEIEAALEEVLAEEQLVLGTPSSAADQDVYVVTGEYSQTHGITSLADLTKVDDEAVLGGPGELAERSYGPPGLAEIYGVEFAEFRPYDAPAVKIKDLNDGKIQVATFFTTEAAIGDNGYVALEDPEGMILPQNVAPLMASAVADNPAAVEALDAVSAALTTEDLTALNKSVDADRRNPDEVAAEWLAGKGLA
ncbi:glycine/betaine ABC transporter substrate-binding protein [Auraticoccus sp. F435]|uniref:Glycine/betaine ABC transporter substrate-binding protein n=1 Tax=Auraticoccus cholistanensis TaxID=2656650 RepID=A0A6A9URU0_9ACTN|nr:ABC transporter substrate-binding protein [Auraticoccus cholistanensis]MVA75298.1 glycine/betaine ABC transporter substrate-binding protein [Auraticoccus cholistanensis]